jgi:hypothetical protein
MVFDSQPARLTKIIPAIIGAHSGMTNCRKRDGSLELLAISEVLLYYFARAVALSPPSQ